MLVDASGILKLSDFGLATVYVGAQKSYSHQVATRWYRAPELLFGSRKYDTAVDLWAVGAIFAELLRTVPLFPGQNDIDQLYRVVQVLGNPDSQQWPVRVESVNLHLGWLGVDGTGLNTVGCRTHTSSRTLAKCRSRRTKRSHSRVSFPTQRRTQWICSRSSWFWIRRSASPHVRYITK